MPRTAHWKLWPRLKLTICTLLGGVFVLHVLALGVSSSQVREGLYAAPDQVHSSLSRPLAASLQPEIGEAREVVLLFEQMSVAEYKVNLASHSTGSSQVRQSQVRQYGQLLLQYRQNYSKGT